MASNSPPPSDACPELTPDNGTPTSSSSGAVNWTGATRQGQQDANNALHIFNNGNHQASSPGNEDIDEQQMSVASPVSLPVTPNTDRVPPPAGFQYPRSPHPTVSVPPQVALRSREPTRAISPVDIGSPEVPLEFDWPLPYRPHSASVVRFATEGPIINSSPPSPSRRPTMTPRAGSVRPRRGHRGLADLVRDFSAWFTRVRRGNRDEAQPRRRFSLGWFSRRRNAGS